MAAFFEQNIVIVYFLYGLAFFSMGLAVWLESGRTSELRLARAMGPLAAFGLLHGLHEWAEMFQLLAYSVDNAPAIGQSAAFNILRAGLLASSFLMLIIFGVRLIHVSGRGRGNERNFIFLVAGALISLWLVSVVATQSVYQFCFAECLSAIDVLTRYILAIPGALLAAWAMILEQRAFRERGMAPFGKDLRWAAAALILYGVVGQIFPAPSVLFPANIINSELFLSLFGFPVQFFRALMAAVMAVATIRALRAFELEHQQHLSAARSARLTAQRQALETQRRAREETEQLNRQLQLALQDLTLLYDLSRGLAASLESDTLLSNALQTILSGIPRLQAGMILMRESSGEQPRVVARAGCDNECGPDCGLVCDTLREMGAQVVNRGSATVQKVGSQKSVRPITSFEPPADEVLERQGRIVAIPLLVQNEVRGSLVLGVREDTAPLSARDLSLLGTIAGQLSMAVENAMLYQQVQAREALRGELYRRIVAAQERERQRIARELHDGAGQMLTGLGLGLKAAADAVQREPSLASRQLTELKDLNAQALQELRDLISDLRPSVLDDLGLVPALQGHIQNFSERCGVETDLLVDGRRRRLQPEIETVLFRITQEALNNVAKHASASQAMVRLFFTNNAVQLIVTDDGCGFDPDRALGATNDGQRRAWGLLGMQERVTLVGGECEIASRIGQGSTVRVLIPLTNEDTTDGREEDPDNIS